MKEMFKKLLHSDDSRIMYSALIMSVFIPFFISIVEILSITVPNFPVWVKTALTYNFVIISYITLCLYLIINTNKHLPKFYGGKSISPISLQALIFLGIYIIIVIECFYIGNYVDNNINIKL